MLAFAMFSRLPVPRTEWNEENQRGLLAAFPLMGVVVGAAAVGWGLLCRALEVSPLLCGVGFALLPLLITGGIHMDGFCDTVDALASHGSQEKKQEILKDSHIGAFAVIGLCAYFLLYTALAAELEQSLARLLSYGLIFVFSRGVGALGLLWLPRARTSGLAHLLAQTASRRAVWGILGVWVIAAAAGMLVFGRLPGLMALLAGLVCFAWFCRIARREFGGVSGDLVGWYIQTGELFCLGAMIAGQYMAALLL